MTNRVRNIGIITIIRTCKSCRFGIQRTRIRAEGNLEIRFVESSALNPELRQYCKMKRYVPPDERITHERVREETRSIRGRIFWILYRYFDNQKRRNSTVYIYIATCVWIRLEPLKYPDLNSDYVTRVEKFAVEFRFIVNYWWDEKR